MFTFSGVILPNDSVIETKNIWIHLKIMHMVFLCELIESGWRIYAQII